MHCKLSKPCLKAKSFCGSSNVQLRTACLSVLGKNLMIFINNYSRYLLVNLAQNLKANRQSFIFELLLGNLLSILATFK